jgi:antitoxin component YwqK of YwqJK toxin-antitoxin module
MKRGLLLLFIFSNKLMAQPPWKLEKSFSLAFQSSYEKYTVVKQNRDGKNYYIGYNKNDSLEKLFDFEELKSVNKKDGWFNFFDKTNRTSYSIFFEAGIAKKLSYLNPDSLIFLFSLQNNLLNGVHTIYYHNNGGHLKEYGFYKDNARFGKWLFFDTLGNVTSEGEYLGDYNRLLYDTKRYRLITLNKYLDTIKVESFNQKKYDSLKKVIGEEYVMAFPIHLHFKTGLWKYYDDKRKLIKEEYYEKGKLIRTENM